jgi:hypothetical protein
MDPEIEYHRAREIKISARRPLPVQVDGDHIGQTPMTFTAVPGALRALLPATLPQDLLRPEIQPPRYVRRRILSWIGQRLQPLRRGRRTQAAEREHAERR